MKKVKLSLKLTLIAPFITRSSDTGAFGLDYPIAKNVDDKFCFPKKLIKGCLRQAWNELAIPETENLLGKKSKFENDEDNKTVEPERGTIFFKDFATDQRGLVDSSVRISIDAERGSVDDGAMLVIESPFKVGEKVFFSGDVIFFAADENEVERLKRWIMNGFQWITNLGAMENINFGRLDKVELVRAEVQEITQELSPGACSEFLDLAIVPTEPFCISKRRTTGNLFESEIIIPGAAVKGTLAASIDLVRSDEKSAFKALMDNLSKIRFTHCFPSKTDERPVVIPLSLVIVKSLEGFFDVAAYKDAILINKESPSFSVDWKFDDKKPIDEHFGWEAMRKILSVQTAIENNKAMDGQLYAYEKIDQRGFKWLGRIDLSKVDKDERPVVEGQLRKLLGIGLFGLGKTKAIAEASLDTPITNKLESRPLAPDKQLIITLQTPFLLCDPCGLNEDSGSDDLLAAYKATWNDLFGEEVACLSHFFASQSLAGGEYLYKRFQAPTPYNPYLLTDAGSVFVFEVKNADAAKTKIEAWLNGGLPLPNWVKRLYLEGVDESVYWQKLPFLPENGFGEVAVNLEVHWDRNPSGKAEVTEI